ncbi:response regulator [Croceibacterium xixiisoli]|uniref:response regulator n=1 Tax=Croceibacterium xixiisoli TaxID=1476466 RepID=UPI00192609AB|nr:response regulator [Croceibacterium xixiisoli]
MTRLQAQLLYPALAVLLLAPFLADIAFPLGTAVWVAYLLPAVLAYLAARPQVPLIVAGLATILTVVGFVLAPEGIAPEVAIINRGLGLGVAWIIATIGFYFIRNRQAIRREEWLQNGQLGLAEAVGGEQPLDRLGASALTFLCGYLGASAGAIFIRNGEGFRRQATYGVPANADVPEQFDVGDGLLGQAVADRRNFTLTTVPEGYLYFGSALGMAKPPALLLATTYADGAVNGVIELGLPQDRLADAEGLFDRISGQLGVSIRSGKYRARLRELLEETQQQAEELQTQSEELRANNDELETQSRQLQDTAARLETQQSELEQSNAQLEEQTSELEAQRDDLARTQASLRAQASELETASRYKSEFLANMSHELRTPLNSLLIMARLLAENRAGNLSSEQVRHAQTIETSGNDLLTLINDILDISKIEAGKLELQPRRMRIQPMLEKMRAVFGPAAASKGIGFAIEASADAEEIDTDQQRLEQVLKNFLSNAIKFTERGEVTLSTARQDDGRIAFIVRDTGVGIPADQHDAIFEAFRQADGTISRKYGGTGLGLSISRELARLLGGDVVVESQEGKGSAFSVILPERFEPGSVQPSEPKRLSSPTPTIARPQPSNAGPALRRPGAIPEDDRERLSGDSRVILIVEDDPVFARILCDLAHEQGFECLIAGTADEGALLARQYLPSAVILDMNLPDHTGLSVLDRIKRDVRTRHIPVHVVSVDDDSQAALSGGAIGYLFKPVRREQLVDMLEGLEARMAQRMRRVLVVEDDAQQAESVRLLLASRDVETVEAHSATQCFELLGLDTFDCMVLDLNLPDASGLDLLERLSGDESVGFPPVIVYTGRDLSPDEELRLRKYSKSIIVKGAKSPERLLDEVTLFLHQVVSELPEPQQQLIVKSLNRDATLEGRRVLVVEDDIRNIYALSSVLEPHGVDVRIARNGVEALRLLDESENGTAEPVDLVLMDVMMPEMDGLTATREIRSRSWAQDLPIIALTAKAMERDQHDCLNAGANDYLAKPLDVDKLLSLVRVWMPR